MKKYKTYIQEMICTKCGKTIERIEKNITKKICLKKPWKVCDSCKKKTSLLRSERMKNNNPMFISSVREQQSSTLTKKYQDDATFNKKMQGVWKARGIAQQGKSTITEDGRRRLSDKMRNNNPMKNPDVVKKVKETLKDHIYPKGSKHGNWKGNRPRNHTIRTRLYTEWVLPHLKNSEFKCEVCKAEKVRLEVHHDSETYAAVIERMLKKRILADLSDADFEVFIEEIIREHTNIEGLTVCIPCHKKIDKARR